MAIFSGGEVVPTSEQNDIVEIGTTVRFRDVQNDLEDKVFIGSHEQVGMAGETAEGIDVATAGSPIGSSLLGRKVGDTVTVTPRNGSARTARTMQLEILEISLPLSTD